jgi:hypothetical protein
MKKMSTLKTIVLAMIIALFMTDNVSAQDAIEIPKDDWTAYAYRYRDWGLPEWAINDDRTDASIFGMGGSASKGRWFMVDMGESHLVVSVLLEYLRTGDNHIKGFNVYVTDEEYPFQPASGPGNTEDVVGELFDLENPDIDDPAAVVEYPTAERVQEVIFDEPVQGRYIWIVSNGPTAEWWEMHQFSAFTIEQEEPPIAENEIPKDDWTAYAYRYRDWGLPEWAIDNDRTDTSIFGMGGSASDGRWFMVDMFDSYLVDSVKLEYLRDGANFINGFNVYVTDKEYPFQAASAPGNTEDVVGELFDFDHPDVDTPAGVVEFPTAEKIQTVVFTEPVRGRYIWIVSNGPTAEWWELHEFTAFGTLVDETNVREVSAPGFVFYPNPLSPDGRLTISIEKGVKGDLIINDLAGRIVYRNSNLTQGQNTLDIDLKSGMYIISIEGKQAKKLIVR